METHDVIVIGAGHNGLTLGCYLARAGVDVIVLDRRAEFGGGLSTEEVTIPGFYHNLHSNFHGAMPFFPPYGDFELEKRNLTYIHPEANIGMPLRDGRALVLYVDELKSYEQISRFSERDAQTYLETRGVIASHLEEVLAFAYSPPIVDPRAETVIAEKLSAWFGDDLFERSALEFVQGRFEDPHVQALLLFHMAVGGWDIRLPRLAGLAAAFLAYITNWQLCRGGSHHLAHVMGSVLLSSGGELREHCHVRKIRTRAGRAVGVTLADGTELDARMAVVSTVDPHQTFLTMLDDTEVAADFRQRVEQVQYGHGDILFGVHLALDEAPHYTAASFNPDIDHTFNVNIGYETAQDLIEHYEEIDRNELPRVPRLEVGVNTLFDPSQAPSGKHTAVLWQFAPLSPGGDDPEVWQALKEEYAERCIDSWREYAPNLTPNKVLGVYAYAPNDIQEKLINMRRGGFHCTAVVPDQTYYQRPIPDVANLRTPIAGLYLGGACAHPHGGIIAGPGYNCLHALADDFDLWGRLALKPRLWQAGTDAWLDLLRREGIKR
jgi:phytoene dehydrogenase-like protein